MPCCRDKHSLEERSVLAGRFLLLCRFPFACVPRHEDCRHDVVRDRVGATIRGLFAGTGGDKYQDVS